MVVLGCAYRILCIFTQVRFTKVYLSKFISAYEKVRINYVRTLLA